MALAQRFMLKWEKSKILFENAAIKFSINFCDALSSRPSFGANDARSGGAMATKPMISILSKAVSLRAI